MTPIGFDSWKQYFQFSLGREFVNRQTGEPFPVHSSLEKVGHALASVVMKPLDLVMREFRNPAVIVALTVAMLAATSLVFYPVHTMAIAYKLFPFLKAIQAHHVKAALFAVSQTVILGLGLRTVGRLSNPELMAAFQSREIIPLSIGTVRIQQSR